MANSLLRGRPQRPPYWLARPLAALGLLLATASVAQAQTLTIQGMGSATSPGSDVTAFVDKVEIVRVFDGAVMTGALANAGFETPSLGAGSFAYRPSGATWTFVGNAGISNSGGGFSPPAIPEGSQTALIQTSSSSVAQPLTLAAGTYQVRFLATQRTNCCGAPYDQKLTVSVGGTQVGTTTPPASGFTSFTSNAFTVNGSGAVVTNNALAFDGSNDYVALPASTPVPVGNSAYTIEAWIKPTSMSANNGIAGWGNYGSDNQVTALRLTPGNGGTLGVYWWNNDLNATVGNLSGQWHHVATTYDGTNRRLYLDGVLKASDTPGAHAVPNANNLRLGSTNAATGNNPGGNGEYFAGSMDEVRIYSVGLTVAQIQADMYSTSPAVPASQKYYANFDQGTAGGSNAGITSLTDQSGNGSTGALNNFALTGTSSNWVRSFPTITGISPTSGAVGSSVTVTGTNLLDATGFAFNGTAVAPFTAPSSDLTATVTVPNGATTGPVSVTSATLTRYNGPTFTLAYGDLVVTTTTTIPAGIYNSITVQSGGNGTLADDVTVNSAIVVQSGGRLADGCHLFTGSATFTLQAGGTLDICRPRGILSGPNTGQGNIGAVRVTGTRSYSNDASYSYSGGQSQDTGDGLPSQVRNFTVGTSTDLSLTNPLAVAQVLTLSGAGNLTTGGKALTLLSSSAGTALVVNSGTGTVSGTGFTMQRYIDPSLNSGSGYRHYSAPVSNTTLADLATTGYSPEISQAATYNSSATPGTTTPFPTLFAYDQSRLATVTNNYSAFDKGFVVPTALSAPMSVGQGYVAQIGAAALVDFVGTPNTGDQSALTLTRNAATTANATAAGWQLVGNPYPSPLDWSLVAAADRQNLDGAMYVVQSTGPYAGGYRTYTNGQSTSGTNNPLIASSQGFWVRVSTGQTSGSLTFRNAQRVTTYASQPAFQRTTADPRPALRLELAGQGLADGWVTYAETGATAGFDSQFDAAKLPNSTGLNLSSASATDNLAIDGQAAFTAATVLPLAVGVPAAGTYTLTAAALNNLPAGLTAYLHDGTTGQTLALAVGSTYSFSVTAAQAQAPLLGRFTLQFSTTATPLAAATATLAAQVLVYPNPAHGSFAVTIPSVTGTSVVQAELLNALGQVVRRQQAALPASGTTLTVPANGLAAGVYVLRLAAGGTTVIKRVVLN